MIRSILLTLALLFTLPFQAVFPQTEAPPETLPEPAYVEQQPEQPQQPQTDTSQPETTADRSEPKLMVTSYTLEKGSLVPGKKRTLNVTVKNTNEHRRVVNLKLTLTDETGELIPEGMGTAYIPRIEAGKEYVWKTSLTAVHTAAEGRHTLTLTMEYEDEDFTPHTATDTLRVDVKQPVALDFEGAVLPVKVVQGNTVTVELSLMNTGKSALCNVKVTGQIDHLQTGGCVFVGELPPGESKAAGINFLVDTAYEGETSGSLVIEYEDIYGKKYAVRQEVSTLIEKKVELADVEQEPEPRFRLWWAFLSLGAVLGGSVGCAVPMAVNAAKKRREDEKRL